MCGIVSDSKVIPSNPGNVSSSVVVSARSGPIPSPGELIEYGKVDPLFPERIMSAWENEQEHRRSIARRNFALEVAGLVTGFFLSIGGLCLAFYCAHLGHPTEAALVGGAHLAMIAAVSRLKGRGRKIR